MTSVFIDGAAGTTGLEIADRLAGRQEFSLLQLDEARRKDAGARREALNAADFVILCLPDDAAREAVAMIDNGRTRVIDASTAHRVTPGWVYGFPEVVGHGAVAEAMRVSNPGCYSTGFIALLAPLVRDGLLPADWPYSCNAVSGYSGGGKSLIERFKADPDIAWRGYALSLGHKHVPEMQARCGLTVAPLFSPAVVPAHRGMVVEVPLPLGAMSGAAPVDELRAALADYYAASPIVVMGDAPADGEMLLRASDQGDDRIALFVFANADGSQARLVARLDNLGKGASGACVQNLNIMAGLPETAGLRL
ncbi:MAG: N-acetyl-gamma-glutamyl-phosphate reductase [Sphingopyxis sp.]|uniref:N-acetyl-gamma-glutamyl-phosphate reductase n=1 Tax=Sphingopyxis terrae subsp. terrae NBRC 15098 TaxID=1219058 RepID=A0A142W077_9SPHN|nr:N-acetyl-gamma-glutamyl-phosphate reductase [Sphingopyxis terrae]AMU95443.1 N-acetyl-gamma-glutamyl-phosphate reductase [Sphingopyxis terrae subsp. terrae NBRC 15098]